MLMTVRVSVCLALAFTAQIWLPVSAVGAQQPRSASDDSAVTLRAEARNHPDSVDLLLALGRLLSRRADEVESHFEERVEAAGYLDRAVRLRPHDPRLLLEY